MEEVAKEITKTYLLSDLMQSSLFNRCFYKQTNFYKMAVNSFRKFIGQLESQDTHFEKAGLLQYALLYAKYELNIICKNNLYNYF